MLLRAESRNFNRRFVRSNTGTPLAVKWCMKRKKRGSMEMNE
jgi:hypothetical protein